MKLPVFLGYAFIAAILFNLKLFQVDVWSRVQSPLFFPLCFVVVGFFWAYATWITNQYIQITGGCSQSSVNQNVALLPKKSYLYYLLSAVIPILVFHVFVILCAAAMEGETENIVYDYMWDYFPILLLFVAGYAFLIFVKPKYMLVSGIISTKRPVEKKDERVPITLDRHIDLYVLFSYLLNVAGMGPLYNDGHIRFFDIVFIESYSKERYIILSNGERLLCDNIFEELKQRGLDKWMLKISKNYYINMLLVFYPIDPRSMELELQPEVYQGMLEKLRPEKIKKMVEIGRGMKKRKIIKDFLANKNRMDHKGWDDFIPLR